MSSDSLESLPTRELIRLVRDLQERFAQLEAENLKLREENRRLRKELGLFSRICGCPGGAIHLES